MQSDHTDTVLLVDDDPRLLTGLRRVHHKRFRLQIAMGPQAGLMAVRKKGPFGIMVSDYQMPETNGVEFLSKVREIHPETVRILLTGNADLGIATSAMHESAVFRLLRKPIEPEDFAKVIEEGFEEFNRLAMERSLLEETLNGVVKVLSEVLSLVNPDAFGRSDRVRVYVRQIADKLMLPNAWQYETAAVLSQIGCISVPEEILAAALSGKALPPDHQEIFEHHPVTGSRLIAPIPRLEGVAEMIRMQGQRFDEADKQSQGFLGSQLVRLALALDELLMQGMEAQEAILKLQKTGGDYDPGLLETLDQLEFSEARSTVRELPITKLRVGMTLHEGVSNKDGVLVVPAGQKVSQSLLERLQNYARIGTIPATVRVRMESA